MHEAANNTASTRSSGWVNQAESHVSNLVSRPANRSKSASSSWTSASGTTPVAARRRIAPSAGAAEAPNWEGEPSESASRASIHPSAARHAAARAVSLTGIRGTECFVASARSSAAAVAGVVVGEP